MRFEKERAKNKPVEEEPEPDFNGKPLSECNSQEWANYYKGAFTL